MAALKVIVLAFLIGAVVATTIEDEFKEFMGRYNKEYMDEDEYNFRFQAFTSNKAFIERHNERKDKSHTLAINHLADLTHDEYKSFIRDSSSSSSDCFGSDSLNVEKSIPDNLDWRSTNNVAPVSNEGQCGSVSYVNVANQVSSALSIALNQPPVPLSAQQMMDCYSSGHDSGCNGGDPWDLYLYIIEKGLEPSSVYPYAPNGSGQCEYKASKTVASITGTGNVTTEAAIKSAVYNYGPTTALFDASSQEFQFYKSGIFYTKDCSVAEIDHVLLLVGYGVTSNNTDYWIAQNVWGTGWGMNGYVNIQRNVDTCGVKCS